MGGFDFRIKHHSNSTNGRGLLRRLSTLAKQQRCLFFNVRDLFLPKYTIFKLIVLASCKSPSSKVAKINLEVEAVVAAARSCRSCRSC